MAHVLAAVGIVGAFGAGAAPKDPYAAESLTVKNTDGVYAIKGSPMGDIVLDVTTDTLIPADTYYLAVNFWSAELTGQLKLNYTEKTPHMAGARGDPNATPPAGKTTQPMVGKGTGFLFYTITDSVRPSAADVTPVVVGVDGSINVIESGDGTTGSPVVTLTRAFQGDATHNAGVYRMVVESSGGLEIDTHIRLELGSDLGISSKRATGYRGDLYIYDDLGDARLAAKANSPSDVPDNYLFSGGSPLFRVANKIAKPTIEPMLLTADVGYERTGDSENNVSTGGPFRGFKGPSTDVGVLATINLKEMTGTFLNASTGLRFSGTVNTAARVVVTSDVDGAFGFGNGAGDGANGERRITGDNPATKDKVETDAVLNVGGPPSAFRITPMGATCGGGTALTLSGLNADGDRVTVNPLAETDPTFSADADRGAATITGSGPFQLCVNVSTNEVQIPDVGGEDRELGGYKMTVTPMSGPAGGRVMGPAASGNAGSIERNGASINITYLSLDPSYNQRLVIVNRSSRETEFWMDMFQTEEDTMISGEIRGSVASGARVVVDVQNELMTSMGGQDRASGTLNLTAPVDHVDVMTVQVHPGTGQIDTTMY